MKAIINIEDWELIERALTNTCHRVKNCSKINGCTNCGCNVSSMKEKFEITKEER